MEQITHNKKQKINCSMPAPYNSSEARICSGFRVPCSEERGISLLFTVLIMSVILAIGLGISGIIIQQTRMMGEIGHSVVSFYAAESGVEQELYYLYKTLDPQSSLSGYLSINSSNDASFNVSVQCGATSDCLLAGFATSSECSALNFCLKSVGSYQKTKRAIEINY